MESDERPKRSFVTTALLWTVPAILILLIVQVAISLKDHFTMASAIGKAIGSSIGTGAITIFAFCITDFVGNKTAARLSYVTLFAGILYLFILT